MNTQVKIEKNNLSRKAEEVVDLVLRKNNDYGDAWQKHGLAGVLVRMSDKALRLKNIEEKEYLAVEEQAEDTLMDMAGYALLGLIYAEHHGL